MEKLTCPKCRGSMRTYERSGVLVDQCTECRGIFLDRGELERIIDAESSWHGHLRTGNPVAPAASATPVPHQPGQARPKRKSFFEELFD